MYITELKNKRLLYWGGYKNTIIPKMLREVFDPTNQGQSGGGGGASYGFQPPINTHTTYTPSTTMLCKASFPAQVIGALGVPLPEN